MDEPRTPWRPIAFCTGLGLLVRLAFLLLAGKLEPQSDEGFYVHLAASYVHFGHLGDAYRFIWAPGYPLFLATCLRWFGMDGLFAAKLVQVAASASIGITIMLLAWRLYGRPATMLAGALWCLHLPFIGFTHTLWPETLFLACFLPAIYLVLCVLQGAQRVDRRLLAAGVCFAAALFVKEMPMYFGGVLMGFLVCSGRAQSLGEGVRRASLFFLTVLVCVLPWTLRNFELYGRFVPIGSSLGEIAFKGLNADYKNFDLAPLRSRAARAKHDPRDARKQVQAAAERFEVGRAWFFELPREQGWGRSAARNTATRMSANLHLGLRFANEHRAWLARSSIKKLADLLIPVSFFTRHLALGHYDGGALGRPAWRKPLAVAASGTTILLLIGSLLGFLTLEDRTVRRVLGALALYLGATSMLLAISRYRLPWMPFAVVLSAGFLHARDWRRLLCTGVLVPAGCGLGALLFLWWVDWPETAAILGAAWGLLS